MKKIILSLVIALCANVSALAQESRLPKVLKDFSQLSETLRRTVAREIFDTPAVPLVRTPVDFPIQVVEEASVRSSTGALVKSSQFLRMVSPKENVHYLPESLQDGTPALFRGLVLYNIESLKHILKAGLELKKSVYPALYFSGNIKEALSYASEGETYIPVIVKVEPTLQVLNHRPLYYDTDDNYVFLRDLPPTYITEVLAFLNVDGKLGWYKAILENNEIFFMPAPSAFLEKNKLIIHQFDVPDIQVGRHKWLKLFRR